MSYIKNSLKNISQSIKKFLISSASYTLFIFLVTFFIFIVKWSYDSSIQLRHNLFLCLNCSTTEKSKLFSKFVSKNSSQIEESIVEEVFLNMFLETSNSTKTVLFTKQTKKHEDLKKMHNNAEANSEHIKEMTYRQIMIITTLGMLIIMTIVFILWIFLKIFFIIYDGYICKKKLKHLELLELKHKKILTLCCKRITRE